MDSLQQKIYKHIVKHCGGKMSKIKGVDRTTLTNMKLGKSNLTFKTFEKIARENRLSSRITIGEGDNSITLKIT